MIAERAAAKTLTLKFTRGGTHRLCTRNEDVPQEAPSPSPLAPLVGELEATVNRCCHHPLAG
jgi:hypothetical protein